MTTFTIVSYNIHKGLSAGNRRPVLEQIRSALAATDPDLVLLQEIVGSHARHARRFADWSPHPQTQYLAETLWPHAIYGRSAEHVHGDHGNAILSKLPVRDWQNVDCSVNRWEQRAILHAVLERDEGPPVHVCCVHLNLRQTDRRLQVAQLVQLVRAWVPDDEPLIIGGDFNDWRQQAGEVLCAALGVVDAHVAYVGRHARTFPAWRPLLPLDRIYCRGFDVERVEVLNGWPWRGMSDHLALAARLHLQ
ncbi:MAG TPA: endonuclease/exonuclease/phosphatase family protein [Gammaproteobacteria bacterium]|nr:endonuclease/exonuclease/phosphatase family protein [Gammaproteobacteria bacterium]